MHILRNKLIRLAHANPDWRNEILPLLKTASRIDRREIDSANADLRRGGFDGRGRWKSAGSAISAAFQILESYQIEPDEIFDAWRFNEPSGHVAIHLARSNPEDSFSPESIENSRLAFQWTEVRPRRFEVIAYLS